MIWRIAAALSGASAVAAGAYGAHALKPRDPYYVKVWERGNHYHLLHSLLIAVAPTASGCVSRSRDALQFPQFPLAHCSVGSARVDPWYCMQPEGYCAAVMPLQAAQFGVRARLCGHRHVFW